jgi:beta-aspartyl-dipeptidase (metallo-type)
MYLIQNAQIWSPEPRGIADILVAGGRVAAMGPNLDVRVPGLRSVDLQGAVLTPGLIDQHVHVAGAGGKRGFSSLTGEISMDEFMSVGSTTVVGLLGTDGATRSIEALYAKVQGLNEQGMSAYMFTGYYGMDPKHVTGSIQGDMVFIQPVLGCKIAISDIRSSFPTATDLMRRVREVVVGGMVSGKKGILHFHLGGAASQMDVLFEMLDHFEAPIQHLSPTHVARTESLFTQAIEFALRGGSIDITTGASKYTDPHLAALRALEAGVSPDLITFSTDGHAGLDRKDASGQVVGTRPAPIAANLQAFQSLVREGSVDPSVALKPVTSSPARNLGLSRKGRIEVGADADFCLFDSNWNLGAVMARGSWNYQNQSICAFAL